MTCGRLFPRTLPPPNLIEVDNGHRDISPHPSALHAAEPPRPNDQRAVRLDHDWVQQANVGEVLRQCVDITKFTPMSSSHLDRVSQHRVRLIRQGDFIKHSVWSGDSDVDLRSHLRSGWSASIGDGIAAVT